ncbi:TonB-dependent receptor [Aquisediminimonas sediminicola]|uniref:TonB-dependent receptor n=1 Tax=Alteraquisediminimonas sediminicola TaxID=2676787 RepID=UPI001C8D98EC|nr:TonB-dependent receptor [Aquisediminimonas sediminicola]
MKRHSSIRRFKASLYASIAMMSGWATAHAQEAGASNADGNEIIVTARRRVESIQDTPISVTAIAPSQLEGAAALTIGDLQGAAPNVLITIAPTGAAAANASIRGIAFADIEKSFDPAVGVNVDGVYIGTSTGQMLDFFDIASIEILRGPQGTLFGRNTIAGVINVRRTRPTGEWGGKFEASMGRYGSFGARAILNVPIVEGVLAAKLFEMHQQSDGFYKTIGTGQKRGGSNNENFGGSLLFTPSDKFDALLTLEQQQQKFDPITSSLTRAGDAFCDYLPTGLCGGNITDDLYNVFPVGEHIGRYKAPAATLEMNLQAGGVKISSVTSYRESKETQQQDFSTAGLYLARRDQKYHQISQELRAAGDIGSKIDYVSGLYYFKSKYHILQHTLVFGAPVPYQDTVGKSESYAAFLDLNWEILPRVRVSGGGRWTHDEKSMFTKLGGTSLTLSPTTKSWSKFTPKAGIDYRPNDDMMFYGSWSRGYRSGGFNGRGLSAFSASQPYDPETVDSFEVGLKSEWLDRKLSINVAAFHTNYKSIQQSTTVALPAPSTGNETVVTNAASAKIKGLEMDLTLRPVEGLTLRSSVGYTKSKFGGFIVTQPVTTGVTLGGAPITENRNFDFSGVDLIYAPKITFSVNGEYTHPVDVGNFSGKIKLNAGYRYLARYDQQIAADPALYITAVQAGSSTVIVPRNDPRLRSDPQNLVDASISYIWDMNTAGAKGRVTIYGRNLLDDRGSNTAFTVAAWPTLWGFSSAREPSTYGVQVGFEF